MSSMIFARCAVLSSAASLVFSGAACAQAIPAATSTPTAPINDRPNPYQTIEGWAKLPEGRAWGSTSAVDIDKDGTSIWVAERCSQNSCAGSPLNSVLKFDATGKLVKEFGAGIINTPHGIHVDRDGNIWVTDVPLGGGGRRGGAATGTVAGAAVTAAPAAAVAPGHQIHKFSPDGKLLLSLGVPGGARDTAYFYQPNDVLVAPDGHIFVVEGHSSNAAGNPVARVLKLDRYGKIVKSWGSFGKGPDQFDQPHALAMDSRGRLFVADRGNNLLKIYDQEGQLLDTWTQFSRISGLWIDKDDILYATDSESGSVGGARDRTWKRGIRIGSARTGVVTAFIPDPAETAPSTSAAEGVAVDAKGNIYGAEVGPKALKRYVKKP